MTDVKELFSGIGIIIDENDEPNSTIQRMEKSLRDIGVPIVRYKELPKEEAYCHFHSVSFIILDWNLSGEQEVPQVTIDDNIDFIKSIKNYCYIPIFIFSDEDTHTIEVNLEEKGLFKQDSPNNIFVKAKSDVDTTEKMFAAIKQWIKQVPSVYVLKEWECSERRAKNTMLWELTEIHKAWPSVLMRSIEEDGADGGSELLRMLHNNLLSRILPLHFDMAIINTEINGLHPEDIRKILECERFIKQTCLPKDQPFTGDVYKGEEQQKVCYYINIRPDCDIIRHPHNKDLYLLKGIPVDENRINSVETNAIIFDSGNLVEKINQCYVAFVEGRIIEFSLRDLVIKKWKDIKEQRVGRLLPPYITKIQQKYSFYLQRQALPALPNSAIIVEPENETHL